MLFSFMIIGNVIFYFRNRGLERKIVEWYEMIEEYEQITSQLKEYEQLLNNDFSVLEENEKLVKTKSVAEEKKQQLERENELLLEQLENMN